MHCARHDKSILTLLTAVINGDMDMMEYMVNSGMSLNVADKYGNSPLHVATIKNDDNLEIIDYLLAKHCISVDMRNEKGETPLYRAVLYGRLHSTRRLIQAGANINLPNYRGMTPLHVSVTHLGIAHLLVLHNAHIDADMGHCRDRPLHYAINIGSINTVRMLLFYNADANARDYNNLTPFMKAIIAKQAEIQQVLLGYVSDFNAVTADGTTTLALALAHDSPFVGEIIQRGADVNYVNTNLYGLTACAFMLCLYVPNHENFKLIWDRLYYDQNINSINLIALFDHLTPDNLEKYIDVIIKSDNVQTAVASLIENRNYDRFICKFAKKNLKPEQLTKLTYRLILFGYSATSRDLNAIFINYGHCDLFKMLVYM